MSSGDVTSTRRPVAEHVQRVAEEIGRSLVKGRRTSAVGSVWVVAGEPTAGKTAVLETLRDDLAGQKGTTPVFVSPPSAALDTGALALLQIAIGLYENDLIEQRQLSQIQEPRRRWDDKVVSVRTWLTKHRETLVLLCDEPARWPPDDASYFSRRALDIVNIVLDGSGCRTVVSGNLPKPSNQILTRTVSAQSDPAALFSQERLLPYRDISTVLLTLVGDKLASYSSLDLRLLVAYAVLETPEAAATWVRTPGKRPIAEELLEALRRRPDMTNLYRVWRRLALVRQPFDDALIAATDGGEMSDDQASLLERCLLVARGDRGNRLMLHDTLRSDVIRKTFGTEGSPRQDHRALADYYLRVLDARPPLRTRYPSAMEAFHHATRALQHEIACRSQLEEGIFLRPLFADQLNMLAFLLSYRYGQHEQAAEIYGRVLDLIEDQPYAMHYRAYNLDAIGANADEVETKYEKARNLGTPNALWHARFVAFLIIQSRLDDARQAWREALLTVAPPDAEPRPEVFRTLHLPVLASLLARGYLSFAEEIIEDVPEHVLARVPGLLAIQRRLEARIVADELGSLRPAREMRRDWWTEPPLTLREALSDDAPLSRWLAGRVVFVDGPSVTFRVADIRLNGSAPPALATTRVEKAKLQEWDASKRWMDLQPGDFIEIGIYGGKNEIRIGYPPPTDEEAAPAPEFDPDRYLKHNAGWTFVSSSAA